MFKHSLSQGFPSYRGRIAPSPTGYLHLGHLSTFSIAAERARAANGVLVFRDEDIDPLRSKNAYATAAIEDLRWLGLSWQEGPDIGGPFGPYKQSDRMHLYRHVWEHLKNHGYIYPCKVSRKDWLSAASAPNEGQSEEIFPVALRPKEHAGKTMTDPGNLNWRFHVPDETTVSFLDQRCGEQRFVTGKDFGDFLVWRKDGVPSYELAVVADDHAMNISEVVRGEDLLLSTARQLLIYAAMGWESPLFFHAPLMRNESGIRLAKRHDSLSIRNLRENGKSPETIFSMLPPR